ncbi:MAG TPA: hypothetical protein DCE41_20415 [Cytophagales bacterium]|nr:hypothetical protein [Cytophagales bacterium]HAA23327.1 hypothetical protein [Cytophagales bacterium]HAP64999.1 hypothetical protein [Cytophagales bacterium]
MEWYLPITVLPGIALLILSTSNFVININQEIKQLKQEEDRYAEIIQLKLAQLRRLSIAISGLYLTVLFLTLAGLLASWEEDGRWMSVSLIIGITIMVISICFLISFSIRAVLIRQKHLRL